MRLVIDLIRGKSVDEALHLLHFSTKHAAKTAEKVLRSAVSNLQNKDDGARLETADMTVKAAYVDGGMTMKRISPAPMGRAYRIRKRSNHVTIVIEGSKEEKKAIVRPKSAKKADAKPQAEAKPKSEAKKKSGKKSASTETPAPEETK
jgi:large subunit ribosomal protein L22